MAEQMWDVQTGPGLTALGLAAARAVETGMPDRLVEDPWGAAFLEAVDSPVPFPVRWPAPGDPVDDQQALLLHGTRYIGLRTRLYDDYVTDAVGSGLRQVVLLAVGLDTRAFRLPWPADVRLFELDQPQVLDFKAEVLARCAAPARCARTTLGVDLRDADWPRRLEGAGFDPGQPCVWLAEGLLAYLPADAKAGLLRDVDRLSAAGSRLALDRLVDVAASGSALQELTDRSGMPMRQLVSREAGPDLPRWLSDHGWGVAEETVDSAARRYDRDLSDPFARAATPPWLGTMITTAVKTP